MMNASTAGVRMQISNELETLAYELQASEARFRNVFDSTLIGMAVVNAHGVLLEVNTLFSQLLGFHQTELLSMNVDQFTDPVDMAAELHLLKDLFDGKRRSYRFEKRMRTKSNVIRWFELWVTALPNAFDEIDRAIGLVIDITDQKQANRAVHELNRDLSLSNQLLRELAAQNDEIRESERTHIAQEVHDELGQVMTALRLKLSVIELRYGPKIAELTDEIQEMKKLVDKAIHGVRNVVGSLRPSALDLGLIPAIDWLRSEFSRQTSVECVFDWGARHFDLDDRRAVVVFRIVQESLTNVSRHADASRVDISLKYEENCLQVAVRDNGVGFEQAGAGETKTFGLMGMMERAIAIGGRLEIRSRRGEGTVVALTIHKTAFAKDECQ
jgi:PAS domain S-box-containing protein